MIAKGETINPNRNGALISIKLKSLDSILIVFPISPLFDVNCVKESIFLNMHDIMQDLSSPVKIGVW